MHWDKIVLRLKNNDSTLTILDSWCQNISATDVKNLAEALRKNRTLTSMRLWSNNLGDDGAKSIAEALKTNNTLNNLELGGNNNLGDDGAKHLAEALTINNTLTSLELTGNNLGDNGVKSLAEALRTNNTLNHLELSRNNLGVDSAKSIAEALKTNNTLNSLHFYNNNLGDDGAMILAEALKTNKTLTSLNLGYNNLGDDSAKGLAEALRTNNTLNSLDLGNNNLGDNGAKHLAEALTTNSTLTSMSLWDNDLGDDGAKHLAEALTTNSTLTSMNLWGNKIGATGVKNLAEALKTNTILTNLDLTNNRLGTAGVKSLAEALKTNTTLTHLKFTGRNDDIDALLQRNQSIQGVTQNALQAMSHFMLLAESRPITQETIEKSKSRIDNLIKKSEQEIKKLYPKASQLHLIQAQYHEMVIHLSSKQPDIFDSHAAVEAYSLLADTQKVSPHVQDMGEELLMALFREYQSNAPVDRILIDIINLRLHMEKPAANVEKLFARAVGAYFHLPHHEKLSFQTGKVFDALSQINSDQLTKEQHNMLKQIKSRFIPDMSSATTSVALEKLTAPKLAQNKEEKLRQLQNDVATSAKDYCDYSKSIGLSFFHRHGETGRKRAEDFSRTFSQINDYDTARKALIDFLNNPKNGNTHPHSFRTMLLHELSSPESHQSYKDTSTHFNAQLALFTSKHSDSASRTPS